MHIALFSRLTMVEQSFFGLPWVVASVLLALHVSPAEAPHIAWGMLSFSIFIAFMSARSAGMALNRLIDKEIDAMNPRTARRPLQNGEVTTQQVGLLAAGSLFLFVLACWNINERCFFMSPVVVLLLGLYSYTKRMTSLCHFVLGSIHFFAPIFAWVAVTNQFAWAPVFLGLAIWLSIAANDIIYALQDRVFDSEHGLYSIPSRLGERWSMWIAQTLHGCAVLSLFVLGGWLQLSFIYYVGIIAIACLYILFHYLLNTQNPVGINRLFSYCNGAAALLFLCTILGVLVCALS
jgi:4-hydroxybenzoate polyprenyltransferase